VQQYTSADLRLNGGVLLASTGGQAT
jgi:hypothetical protein